MLNKLALFSILVLLFASATGDASPPDELEWPDARILYREIPELVLSAHKRTDRVRTAASLQLVPTKDSTVTEEHLHPDEITCRNIYHDDKKHVQWHCRATGHDNYADRSLVARAVVHDVSCEGWSNDDDHYVRAGSCMANYTITYTFSALSRFAGSKPSRGENPIEFAILVLLSVGIAFAMSFYDDDDEKSKPESADTVNPTLPAKHITATDLETNATSPPLQGRVVTRRVTVLICEDPCEECQTVAECDAVEEIST